MSDKSMKWLIREYLSKCKACDECFAEVFCTLKGIRNSREPQHYCINNIEKYLREQGMTDYAKGYSECFKRFVMLLEKESRLKAINEMKQKVEEVKEQGYE